MNATKKKRGNVETTARLMCAEGKVEIRQNARVTYSGDEVYKQNS